MKKHSIIAFTLMMGISLAVAHGQTTFEGPWTEVGPNLFQGIPLIGANEPMSGQVSALAVDLEHDPSGNLVYVGTSSGGVWKSTNGLSASPTFVPISDQTQSLSVGAIALDTRPNPSTIYVGTGAPDNSANISGYTGVGILISHNGGKSWTKVDSADNGAHPFTGLGFSSILVDPQNTNIVLAATGMAMDPNHPETSIPQGDPGFQNLGIYRSNDAGKTWNRVMSADYATQPSGPAPPTVLTPSGFFHIDIVYDPTGGTYFAGITGRGLFASTDSGAHWKPLADLGLGNGLPPADQTYRISLATRDGVLWALLLMTPFASPPATAFALYQSDDQGAHWRQIVRPEPPPPPPPPVPQPTLANSGLFKGALMYVAAPPNARSLLVGTSWLYRKIHFRDPRFPWVWIENNLHGDQHAIAFVNATTWYVGDDGGAWATTDRGNSWTSLNSDLHALEFFSADEDSSGSPFFAGGMQDNGPALTSNATTWTQLAFGDGTYVAADPLQPKSFFMSEESGDIFYVSASNLSQIPPLVGLTGAGYLAPFEILPTDIRLQRGVTGPPLNIIKHGTTLLAGSNIPWLIAFDPASPSNPCQGPQPPKTPCNKSLPSNPQVAQLLPTPLSNSINFIAPVPGNPTVAYLSAGPELYQLNTIGFSGYSSLKSISGGPVNGDILGHLAVSFTKPETLYLIKAGFVEGQKIFKTSDDGKSWTNISGNLPNVPLNWITLDPVNPGFIYLATNIGVFVATDGGVEGEQWKTLGTGLPNVPVIQLKIVPGRRLLAATYGRNVWLLTQPYNSVGITIETGNDDARSDTELWATISGEPPICLKPSNNADPDAVCNNSGSATDQNGQQKWSNWTTSGQTFDLHTPSTLVGATITITLIEHNSGLENDDNWDIQGIDVTASTPHESSVLLLDMTNPRNSNNDDNCMARLKGSPNPSSVTYNLSFINPGGSNLNNPTFGPTPPGNCPQ